MNAHLSKSRSSASSRAKSAFATALQRQRPDLSLDRNGYVADWRDNVLPHVATDSFQGDLEAGDGRELESKFRAAHSSSALAVNVFARFKGKGKDLKIPRISGTPEIRFEVKCPIGLSRGKSPNLDVFLESPSAILGIESKCTEYLSFHKAEFRPAYFKEINDNRRQSSWFRMMEFLVEKPDRYQSLNAAQLVKHAFGLKRHAGPKDGTLLYLFWEPSNAGEFEIFYSHRSEIDDFSSRVNGDSLKFLSLSYQELWNLWEGPSTPPWLSDHLALIRSRYNFSI